MAEAWVVAIAGAGRRYAIGETHSEVFTTSDELGGGFRLIEFEGPGGPWTVPQVREKGRESFYILEGAFTFLVGDENRKLEQEDFLSVAPGTIHMIRAGASGGCLLCLTPPGLERVFIELSELSPDALTDREIRRGPGEPRRFGAASPTGGLTESASRDHASPIVTFVILTGSLGRSCEPLGAVAIASSTSSPLVSWPKIV